MVKFRSKYEGPWADPRSLCILSTGEWRYQRPVTTTDKCCHCGWCSIYCPTGCIEDRGAYFAANLDYCKGCSICARVCPIDAIKMVKEEV
jgi:2-oxoacid:acceptor oxidoreductase delta subunit (pyruvate/2-ketoisovalerate family)